MLLLTYYPSKSASPTTEENTQTTFKSMMEVDQGHLLLAILQQKDSLKDTSYFGLSWCGPQPARDEVLSRLLKGNFKADEETTNPCTLEPALVESLCEGLSLDWCSRSQTFHMVCQGVQPPSGLASCQTQGARCRMGTRAERH